MHSEQYARAREAQQNYYADEIGRIAYDALNGSVNATAAKVAMEGLKWRSERLARKSADDPFTVEPVKVEFNFKDARKDPEEFKSASN